MESIKKKTVNILLSSAVATVFCQIGMALTCVNASSVMRMPTIKNSVIVFAVALIFSLCIDIFLNNVINYTKKTATSLILLVLFLLLSVIVSFVSPIQSLDGKLAYRYPMVAAIGVCILIYQLIVHRKKPEFSFQLPKLNISSPEATFSIIAIVFGLIICILLPKKTMTCVDDESHYWDTLVLSEGIYTAYDENDTDLIYGWDDSKSTESHTGAVYVDANPLGFQPKKLGYLSPATGLWLGRILGLDISGVYFCGRLSGLVLYVIGIYYAIKRLINGKYVLGMLCVSPVAIQYAVGYSYDAWLMAFTSISLAYYFGAVQRPSETLSVKEIIIIIGAMFIGTWPKMPYAILFLLLLVMPKDKFEDSKQRKHYYLCIISCIVIELILTFATSFGLGDVADTRGGENISAYGQIAYMLNNPGEFINTLITCLKDFIKPFNSWEYLTSFGSYKNSNMYILLGIAMVLTAILDNEVKTKCMSSRISGVAAVFVLIVIIAVLMYLSFTPVGQKTVNGVQARYKLQLIFPLIMSLASGFYIPKKKWIKVLCRATAYGISSFCLLLTIVSIV